MDAQPEILPQRPIVGVSVLVRRDGRVLLVRRGKPPLAGLWSLPGGKVEFGERLETAAIREIREETGIDIDGLERIDMAEIIVKDTAGAVQSHAVITVFAGRYVAGTVAAGDDAADARWIDGDTLAGLTLTEDTRRVIETHGLTLVRASRIVAALALTIAMAASLPVRAETTGPSIPAYETDLLRLSEILGAVQFLRELCGTEEGAIWRDQMQALIDAEQPHAEDRARMIDHYNRGYESYRSVYRVCTDSARLAVDRYLQEGAEIAAEVAARYGK